MEIQLNPRDVLYLAGHCANNATTNVDIQRRCDGCSSGLCAKAEAEADIELARLIDKLCVAWCFLGLFAGVIVGLLVTR